MSNQDFNKEPKKQSNAIADDDSEYRKVKLELEKTVNTYMALFDAANDAVFLHDARDGHVLAVNQKAVDCFGYTRDEMLVLGVSSFCGEMPPYDQAAFHKKIRRAAQGENLLFEWQARKKNGDFFWLEVALKTLEFEGRKRIVIMARDISLRKKIERELQLSRKLSTAIQRLAKIGAWELDLDTQTTFWTEEVFRIHDMAPDLKIYDSNDLIQKGLACFHPADKPVVWDAFTKCIDHGIPFCLEMPFTTTKGREIWIQTEAERVRDENGRERVLGYFRDITSRKEQEAALLAKEIEYKTILQTAEDGFLLTDSNGRVLEINAAYRQMSGYNEKELLSISLFELEGRMTPDEIASEVALVKKRGHDRFNTRHRKKDGSLYDVEVSVKHLPNKGGTFVNFVRDISALKRAEKEKLELQTQLNLSQKLESIGRLAGGVAHDLNNLLTPILGYCEILMEEIDKNASHQKKLKSIYQAGQGARSLISQLLAFSRKQTLDFSLIDVDKVISAFKKLLRRTIREDIRIEINDSPGAKTIMADRNQLEQIIMNLAVNAADAMPSGGTLTINTDMARLDETYASRHPGVQPGAYVLMSFVDTGHGMDQDVCNKIFEPFYSTKGTQGTGLGLATVYGIVKQHRGNIWVYSELDKGSVFKVYLPYASGTDSEPALPKEQIKDLKGTETILLAEDNDDVRDLTAEILMDSGYTVFTAGNGNAALETWAARDESFHLLVTDVIMPEMNGKELFDTLSSLDGNIKVLYMSGYPDNAIACHGVIDENISFIQKPFNKNDLLVKVRQVLDNNS
nr:PAS domain S-box protein [uncultured Desulfobacter sp.]